MENFIEMVFLVALAASFVVLLAKKWGIAEWMQIHGDRYMSRLFACDLCMSFWAAVVICVTICCITNSGMWIIVPMFSTPVSRMLV